MISLLVSAVAAGQPPILSSPVEVQPLSAPSYEVQCDLRNMDQSKHYRIALSQRGGLYRRLPGRSYGGRSPTFVKVSRDDLGIFDDRETELFGNRVSEWYDDGPFELVAKDGGLTFYKTAERQAFLKNPTKIAVTAKAGRLVRDGHGNAVVKETILLGTCNVAWKKQGAIEIPGAEGKGS